MKHRTFTYEVPLFSILHPVRSMQRQGENAFDAAKRVLLDEALHVADGNVAKAAELLGVTQQRVSYLKTKRPEAWATVHPKRPKVMRFPVGIAAGSFKP